MLRGWIQSAALTGVLLVGCGRLADIDDTTVLRSDDRGEPAAEPIDIPDAAGPIDASPACDLVGEASATVTWNDSVVYVTPETTFDDADHHLHVWGSIFDPQFRIDEGVLAFDFPLALARGDHGCGAAGVAVTVAEHRGFEFTADPNECTVHVDAVDACGHVRFTVAAAYDSTYYGRSKVAGTFDSYPAR